MQPSVRSEVPADLYNWAVSYIAWTRYKADLDEQREDYRRLRREANNDLVAAQRINAQQIVYDRQLQLAKYQSLLASVEGEIELVMAYLNLLAVMVAFRQLTDVQLESYKLLAGQIQQQLFGIKRLEEAVQQSERVVRAQEAQAKIDLAAMQREINRLTRELESAGG